MASQEIADGFDLVIIGGNLIIKDTQATPHYWRLEITVTLGIPSFTFTDLGTTPPA